MDQLKRKAFKELVTGIIRQNLELPAYEWLEEKAIVIKMEQPGNALNTGFAAVPRKTGKNVVRLSKEEQEELGQIGDGLSMTGWSIDRVCRLWLLLQVYPADEAAYVGRIESLFQVAEMNEAVALYSSLYLLEYPAAWRLRAAEGIRSNIGTVLEAIMYENPYPSQYLDEPQWNQLVLKAFFTDKDVNRIIGLDQRVNSTLASILTDYANERWAAHRTVDPRLWRLAGRFIDAHLIVTMERMLSNGDPGEKKAAGLACSQSAYPPARELLTNYPELESAIEEKRITWNSI